MMLMEEINSLLPEADNLHSIQCTFVYACVQHLCVSKSVCSTVCVFVHTCLCFYIVVWKNLPYHPCEDVLVSQWLFKD